MSTAPTPKVAAAAVGGAVVTLLLGATDRLGVDLTGAEGSALGVLVGVALAYLVSEVPSLPIGDHPVPVTLADERVDVVVVEGADEAGGQSGEAPGVDATASGGDLRKPRRKARPT